MVCYGTYVRLRLEPWAWELPAELILRLRRLGIRPPHGGFFPPRHPFDAKPTIAESDQPHRRPPIPAEGPPPAMTPCCRYDGAPIVIGDRVAPPQARPLSADEFATARVFVGSYVVTRCHTSWRVAKRYDLFLLCEPGLLSNSM